MKKGIFGIVIIIAVAIAAFFYFTRPVSKSENVGTTPLVEIRDVKASAEETKYRIASNQSQVQYTISEELRGEPFTVVGKTDDISGEIILGKDSEGNTSIEIGTITIDARTFVTDSAQRDGAVGRFVVQTETLGNEYITFKPTKVQSVPKSVELGKQFPFTVTGDLTIAGITKPATFAVVGTLADETFSASVQAIVKRSDYELTIPSIPFVANVPDTFEISAKILAEKVQ